MDWVEGGEDPTNQAFTILRDVPSKPVKKSSKDAKNSQSTNGCVGGTDELAGFPELVRGEGPEARRQRLEAYHTVWQGLTSSMEAALQQTNTKVFGELHSFARGSHRSPAAAPRPLPDLSRRVVPTALAFSGSINSADHASTYPDLVAYLRQQGCYAALLSKEALTAGNDVPEVLRSLLQQFSGEQHMADDFIGLVSWYQDQVQGAAEESRAGRRASTWGAEIGRIALATPAKVPRPKTRQRRGESKSEEAAESSGAGARTEGESQGDSDQEGDEEGETSAELALEEGRVLRGSTIASSTAPAGGKSRDRPTPADAAQNAQRPLVVVLAGAEGAHPPLLRDLLTILSEGHAELPIVLVLGLAYSSAALQRLVGLPGMARLRTRGFALTTAQDRCEAMVSQALLGPQFPGVLFSPAVMRALHDHFRQHDASTQVYLRGLQVACLRHFPHAPLSALCSAAADPEALTAAVSALPAPVRTEARAKLGHAPQVILTSLVEAWSGWAVSLRWLSTAAAAVGLKKRGSAWGLMELYEAASRSDFMARGGSGASMLTQLAHKLDELSREDCLKLAQALLECAAGVFNGLAAVASQAKSIQAVIDDLERPAADPGTAPPLEAAGLSKAATTGMRNAKEAGGAAVSGAAATKAVALDGRQNRRAALAGQIQSSAAARQKTEAALKQKGLLRSQRPTERLAAVLREAAEAHLTTPPCRLPGASVLCCRDVKGLLSRLTAAPRLAIHTALAHPHTYLGTPADLGMSPDMDDTCIAYKLFLEFGEHINVAGWFEQFSQVYNGPPAEEQGKENSASGAQRQGSPDGRKPRGRGRGRTKGALQEQGETTTLKGRKKHAARSAPATADTQPRANEKTSTERVVGLVELAARFKQASSELQLLGLLRPAKRRRGGDFAQKLVFCSELGDEVET